MRCDKFIGNGCKSFRRPALILAIRPRVQHHDPPLNPLQQLLGRVDFLLERVEAAREIGSDVLAGIRPLDQHAQIVGAPPERLPQRLVFLQTPPALHHLLRFGLVIPEIGLADPLLDAAELFVEAGILKDASVVPRPGVPGRRTVAPDLRVLPP